MILDDAGFVRAPVELVYRRLSDVDAWPSWWPGLSLRRQPPLAVGQRWAVELASAPLLLLRFGLVVDGHRPGTGFLLTVDGDLRGEGEFWFESVAGGTVVHHIMRARTPLVRPHRISRAYRRSVRRALWGCKDLLQLEVRTSLGVTP